MHICGTFDVYMEVVGDECSPDCINKREISDYYTRDEIEALLAAKQDVVTAQDIVDLLGYREAVVSEEACDGTKTYHAVLVKEVTP